MTDEIPRTDLAKRVSDLEDRVSELETQLDAAESGENPSGSRDDLRPTSTSADARAQRLDHYDRPVVNRLERGETYHVRRLTQAYLTHSKITDEETAKDRVKKLVRSDGFGSRGGGEYEFVGWGE